MEIEVPKTSLHQPLESSSGIVESKRHPFAFIEPTSSTVNTVNGLLSSSISTCQYPDFRSSEENHSEPCKLSSVSSIWGSKYASLMVWLFSFLRSIQNLRLPSFFLDQDYCASPWTVQLLDSTNIQHLLDMGPHIIVHVGRYTLVMLLEGHLICYLYFVFDQSSFAQAQVTVYKEVLPFEQQLSGLLLL